MTVGELLAGLAIMWCCEILLPKKARMWSIKIPLMLVFAITVDWINQPVYNTFLEVMNDHLQWRHLFIGYGLAGVIVTIFYCVRKEHENLST